MHVTDSILKQYIKRREYIYIDFTCKILYVGYTAVVALASIFSYILQLQLSENQRDGEVQKH